MKNREVIKKHVFEFDTEINSGEGLTLVTEFYANGDPITENNGVYMNQYLTLQSYCNSVTFNLIGIQLTPEKLRQLANELERERQSIKN